MMLSTGIGVLTSGGDAPGMNAALRAVVRTALSRSVPVYAIYEGYRGMVEGGDRIRPLGWDDVGGIMHRGGTIIGTARCREFRTREGRLQAAANLIAHGINRLVVIGGDGSLTGADTFRREWSSLLAELVETGKLSRDTAAQYPFLALVGLVGSIDNDFYGTDMTIGADSALHRITAAIDALVSTAASHQRTFVVEVMGRHCGYLALMGAIAGGADYVLIPENPPEPGWEDRMCTLLRAGRASGRRESIVVIAEGARDRDGNPISADYVRRVLEERMGEDARVTILGHVQRGGTPSAFDRWMSTLVGYAAVEELLSATPEREPQLIGMRYHRITRQPLMYCVEQTQQVATAINAGDYQRAMELRSGSFKEMFQTFQALSSALPSVTRARKSRIALLHAGGPAPGMNTAVRAAVRLGLDQGHTMLVVRNGFDGLIAGEIDECEWQAVDGWGAMGGAELGTSRRVPAAEDLAAVAQALTRHRIDGLLVIGGWNGYQAAHRLYQERAAYEPFNIPIICLPASINNDLPGSELSIGADTALNAIVEALDRIKQSAVAVRRTFVVEVMGRYCGYLALMGGMASGAERVYLHEEGVTLDDLRADIQTMIEGFRHGKRLSLIIRNEYANRLYTTDVICALFEEEGKDLFDVRRAVLGHLQQGGSPSPYDRIQATRLAARCIHFLSEELDRGTAAAAFIGFVNGKVRVFDLGELPHMVDAAFRRPKDQWWLELVPIVRALAQQKYDTRGA
ncbi:MAG: 6-phosphofructokinase [Roseiflexus sp.]|uniref:6-phosphofructokinase n=1 Tax=Roseiflexus sp. TaxID=2562120 RepID=UPI0026002736|nr:6-phosphofructokinase [Roseiflexus sp.]MCL6540011.1 6-phosphofructokinase [Roseiflexus sp.]